MNKKETMRWLAGLAALSLAALASPSPVHAIPTFARKYGTSCATCHVAYPRLNAFGEAFKNNGYRMPFDDEDLTKEEPVALGSEGYKRVYPKAIWPGSIPGNVPLSFRATATYRSNPRRGAAREVDNDFQAPENFFILLGGTMGERWSFFHHGHLVAGGEPGYGVARLFARYDQLFNKRGWYLKAGLFEPAAVPHSSFNLLGTANFAINQYSFDTRNEFVQGGGHHGGGLALGRTQRGLEIGAVEGQGRLFWAAGVVNGNGSNTSGATNSFDNNSSKDVYARLAYKWGGMRLDGVVPEDAPPTSSKNWRERSLKLGIFGYSGKNAQPDPDLATVGIEDVTDYQRYGFDLDWRHDDLEVLSSYLFANDDLHRQVARTRFDREYRIGNIEASYVVRPWFIPYTRYEWIDRDTSIGDLRRYIAGAVFLMRANTKLHLEAFHEPKGNDTVLVGLDWAF